MFQTQSGRLLCNDCTYGKYAATDGHDVCKDCPTGKYAREAHTQCSVCPAGEYQSAVGNHTCITCEAGKYGEVEEMESCPHCPAGKYQDLPGQGVCIECPSGKYTAHDKQGHCDECGSCDWTEDQDGRSACVPHPIDCIMGDWNAWGGCSATCDAGYRTRERPVTRQDTCGGIPCTATLETKACFLETCPCETVSCTLEHHTCTFGRERVHRGHPDYHNWFSHQLWKECDGSTHYTIRVSHAKDEKWGEGHSCRIVNHATKECKCRCHDSYGVDIAPATAAAASAAT